MALNVKFLQGTQAAYDALGTYDPYTFYRTIDELNLYLGSTKLSNESDITDALARLDTAESDIDSIETAVGNLSGLETTAQTDLVSAINEVLAAVGSGGTEAVVSITASDDDDYAKIYTIKQGTTTVGTINIPKDMVVSSGKIVTDPEGQEAGTYIELTLANAENSTLYINAGDLIDVYTAAESATQVQLEVSADNVLSATLVAGGVGTTELADGSVTTIKVADGSITKAKLEDGVVTSLGLADTSVQSVTTGTTNGTINVDGEDVAVAGLGSAAYTETTDYDAAGSAAAVEATVSDLSATVDALSDSISELETTMTWETL